MTNEHDEEMPSITIEDLYDCVQVNKEHIKALLELVAAQFDIINKRNEELTSQVETISDAVYKVMDATMRSKETL